MSVAFQVRPMLVARSNATTRISRRFANRPTAHPLPLPSPCDGGGTDAFFLWKAWPACNDACVVGNTLPLLRMRMRVLRRLFVDKQSTAVVVRLDQEGRSPIRLTKRVSSPLRCVQVRERSTTFLLTQQLVFRL